MAIKKVIYEQEYNSKIRIGENDVTNDMMRIKHWKCLQTGEFYDRNRCRNWFPHKKWRNLLYDKLQIWSGEFTDNA